MQRTCSVAALLQLLHALLQLYQLPYIVPELVLSTLPREQTNSHRELVTQLSAERVTRLTHRARAPQGKKKRGKKLMIVLLPARILILEYYLTCREG